MYVMLSPFSCQVIVFIRVRAPEHCPLTDKKHILKSASIISLVTVVSRTLGYVRDQRITLLLGTTLSADAYVLAYRIPNLFRRLVAEGSMTASFIPVFSGANVARDQAVDLNRIIFPYLFFIALAALAMGILNCFHIFGLPAATPVMLNIATIL